MGRKILYELSQELSVLLEDGLESESDGRVPVFFCHPLDVLQDRQSYPEETFGVLYISAVLPERNYRLSGHDVERSSADSQVHRRRPPLWVRVRYVFMVAGGSPETQLTVIAAALETLHDYPLVGPHVESSGGHDTTEGGHPVRIVEEPDAWRTLGLPEHRLTITFEVICPIASGRTETLDRIEERHLRFQEARK